MAAHTVRVDATGLARKLLDPIPAVGLEVVRAAVVCRGTFDWRVRRQN